MRADVPLGGDLGAGFPAHELGEAHRQFALARLRKGLVKPARDHDAQHPVAQEFEPLIGLRPALPARILRRKVGEREDRQPGIAEAITEPRLQRGQFGARLFVHGPTDRGAVAPCPPPSDRQRKRKDGARATTAFGSRAGARSPAPNARVGRCGPSARSMANATPPTLASPRRSRRR